MGLEHVEIRPTLLDGRGRGRRVGYAIWEAVHLPRIADKGGADILHYPADTGPVRRCRRARIVVTVHGVASHHVAGIRNARQEAVWRARVRAAIAASNAVVTVSESSANDLIAALNVRAKDIEVIPHGIDHDRFRVLDRSTVRDQLARLGLPDEFLLYVGNVEPRKNLERLVAAVGRVRKPYRVPLVIAGKARWNARRSLDAIERSADAIYLGPVSQDALVALMNAAVLFTFPSLYEGFGFPVLESMACGTPVVTSAAGALGEVVGTAAELVDPEDVQSIANGIERVLLDDARASSLRSAGLERAARFSWHRSAEAHALLFRRLAA
jgi:alpha-1,3-rhamnosyl/mannosyltransferase